MKYLTYKAACVLALFATLTSCNLEKEVEIELPAYERQYVVECYLEPGKPYNLLLTKSSSYFDSISLDPATYLRDLLADKAVVTITHNGTVHELKETLFLNPTNGKFANYASADIVPADYDQEFILKIATKEGKEINAVTKILPKVLIDSVVTEFQDTFARALTYLTDDQTTTNYYRRTLNFGSLDSIPLQDFATDDKLATTSKFAFGTGYSFAKGDTIFNTIYHMSKEYFEFFRTISIAKASNGNIIAQPSTIKSNVKGNANPIAFLQDWLPSDDQISNC